jgi:hypothetical protein
MPTTTAAATRRAVGQDPGDQADLLLGTSFVVARSCSAWTR